MKNIQETTRKALSGLSPKQREVLELRYGLSGTMPETLDQIGKKMKLTRERIRQIESSALSALGTSRAREMLLPLVDRARAHLVSIGGIHRENLFFDEILLMGENRMNRQTAIRFCEFAFSLSGAPYHVGEDAHHHAAWYATKGDLVRAKNFIAGVEKTVKRHGVPMNGEEFASMFKLAMAQHGITNESIASYYLNISKKFKFNSYGDFGLSIWPQIDPKGMRDRAYLVVKKTGTPMHFSEISDTINSMKFDSKVAQPQTVHNELIKDKRFVLCGRGIYGLREWGIEPGTVRDVLIRILKSRGPLHPNDLVHLVKAQRYVKDTTILLGLQDKSAFHRLDDGRYKIRAA